MSEERCDRCKFWVPCAALSEINNHLTDERVGDCKRFPPSYHIQQDWDAEDGDPIFNIENWHNPATKADDWCGEFKPNGTKFDWSVWSARTRNAFGRGGIRTIEDLLAKTQDDLLQLRNFGATSLFEVREVLAKAGLSLLGE